MSPAAIPILSSIADLERQFEAWIVDIWGVMHNGARAFDAAGAACRMFRASGGTVMLLSNAPRPFSAVIGHMASLGVDPQAYDGGVTSGDATRGMIEAWGKRPVLHIGPERDKGLFAGLAATLVSAEEAEAIVCSGLWDDTKETPADYSAPFERLAARRLPMICANPDLVVERGDKLVYCAGALAALYAEKGGEVIYAGKPYLPIYERTFATIDRLRGKPVSKERILAIGDGVDTDLLGAHRAGLASVLIASAVHLPGGLNSGTLGQLFAARPQRPIAALPALLW
jgi:HAD superfamily hydrolase (TIGR01459 family)